MSFNRAEYDTEALRNNFRLIRRLVGPGCKICTAVKANGYGFGAVPMATLMEEEGADYLAVAIREEGVQLRKNGINLPILVLGAIPLGEMESAINYGLTIGVYCRETALFINAICEKINKRAKIHIMLDTGMHRLGFLPVAENLKKIAECCKLPYVEAEGIFSHLSQTDKSREFTLKQIDTFKGAVESLKEMGVTFDIAHLANSNAILDYPEAYFDMVRPGIILHGFGTEAPASEELQEVLTLKSEIVRLHWLKPGDEVSYMGNFVASEPRLIATVPMGYADGLHRSLSSRGLMLVGGKRVPQVGNICMDQCMIDVTDVPGVKVGDEVVIYGRQGEEFLSCEEQAGIAGTISYELLTSCKRIPKYYYFQD